MALLHSEIQNNLGLMKEEPGSGRSVRSEVLASLIMHADQHMRCFPGIRWIAKESGCRPQTAGDATEWLFRHKAIVPVPYHHRLPKEQHLPPSKYVFQLTGIIEIEGKVIPTTFMSAEQRTNAVQHLRNLDYPELADALENVGGNVYTGKVEIDPTALPEDLDIGMDIDLPEEIRCDFEGSSEGRGNLTFSVLTDSVSTENVPESLLSGKSLLLTFPSGAQVAVAADDKRLTMKQLRQQKYAAQGKKVAADDEQQKATVKTNGKTVSELVLLVKSVVAGGNLTLKAQYRLTDKYSKRGEDGVTRTAESPEFLYATTPLFKAYVQRVIAQAKVISERNDNAPIDGKILCGTIANYDRDSKTTPGWFQFQSMIDPDTISDTAEPHVDVEREMIHQYGTNWTLNPDISPAPKGYEWLPRGLPGKRVPHWIKQG